LYKNIFLLKNIKIIYNIIIFAIDKLQEFEVPRVLRVIIVELNIFLFNLKVLQTLGTPYFFSPVLTVISFHDIKITSIA
jgi:hypothetical protein